MRTKFCATILFAQLNFADRMCECVVATWVSSVNEEEKKDSETKWRKKETAKNGKTARELAQSACAQRLAFANEAIN